MAVQSLADLGTQLAGWQDGTPSSYERPTAVITKYYVAFPSLP